MTILSTLVFETDLSGQPVADPKADALRAIAERGEEAERRLAAIDGWRPFALEINLRCGGTTHPLFALTALTDGAYEPLSGEYRTRHGELKHYAATDHLDSAALRIARS